MKKLLTIIAILFAAASFAQGNLQFNQVRTFTALSPITGSGTFTISTVPAGKVWKIDSWAIRSSSASNFIINSVSILSSSSTPLPIWLKAGDVISCNGFNWNATDNYFISLIEYNIVP